LLDSGWGEIAYEDEQARIVRIRDQKGEPPSDDLSQAPETSEEKKILDEEEKNGTTNKMNVNDEDEDNDNN
jgi:hypothetical protein